MPRATTLFALLLPAVLLLVVTGCGRTPQKQAGEPDEHAESASHDEHTTGDHDAPASLAEGVAELKENYEAIKTAFAAGKKEDAHTPLHEVGHLLDALPKLVESAELSEAQANSAKDAIAQMFEAYSQVDGAIHEGKEPDYPAVSDTLDQAMAALESAVAK